MNNMKKLLGIIVLGLLLSGNAYAKEEVLRCDLQFALDEPDIRAEVEINLNKKMLWFDGDKYNIILLGDRTIKAQSDNGNVKISIDRFDGYITFKAASSNFIGYCKKYNKIF